MQTFIIALSTSGTALNEERKCPWGKISIPLLLKHKWGAALPQFYAKIYTR